MKTGNKRSLVLTCLGVTVVTVVAVTSLSVPVKGYRAGSTGTCVCRDPSTGRMWHAPCNQCPTASSYSTRTYYRRSYRRRYRRRYRRSYRRRYRYRPNYAALGTAAAHLGVAMGTACAHAAKQAARRYRLRRLKRMRLAIKFNGIGVKFARRGDDENAVKYYQKAARLYPGNRIIQKNLRRAQARLKRKGKRKDWADKRRAEAAKRRAEEAKQRAEEAKRRAQAARREDEKRRLGQLARRREAEAKRLETVVGALGAHQFSKGFKGSAPVDLRDKIADRPLVIDPRLVKGGPLRPTPVGDVVCLTCVDKEQYTRWTNVTKHVTSTGDQLKQARERLKKAEVSGKADLIAKERAKVALLQSKWRYMDSRLGHLGSQSFQQNLERQRIDLVKQIRERMARLDKMKKSFDRMRQGVDADEKRRILGDLNTLYKLHRKQQIEGAISTISASLTYTSYMSPKYALAISRWAKKHPAKAGKMGKYLRNIRALTLKLGRDLPKRTKAAGDMVTGLKYWYKAHTKDIDDLKKFTLYAIQEGGSHVAPLLSPTGAAIITGTSLALDVVAIQQTRNHISMAIDRYQAIELNQQKWQQRVNGLSFRVRDLKRQLANVERTRALQAQFAKQSNRMRAELRK